MCSLCYCAMPLPVLIIRRVIYWDHRERKDQSKLIGTMCCSHLNLLTWKKIWSWLKNIKLKIAADQKLRKLMSMWKTAFVLLQTKLFLRKHIHCPATPGPCHSTPALSNGGCVYTLHGVSCVLKLKSAHQKQLESNWGRKNKEEGKTFKDLLNQFLL